MCGWCLTRVGRDTSSMSPGWSLLPLTVITVLALVNSAVSPAGTSSISMRPGSATLLPVSTASTGLLRLSVGAHVHRVRSNTGKCHVWPLLHAHRFQCVTHICTVDVLLFYGYLHIAHMFYILHDETSHGSQKIFGIF